MAKIGMDCKLYRNTGSYASPVWNEIPNVSDVTIALSKGEAETSTRAGPWKTRRGTLKDASIDFTLRAEANDTDYTALLNSFLDNTTIELLALDGPRTTVGSQGLRAVCEVFNFQESQALENAVGFEVSCKPTISFDGTGANAAMVFPSWYTSTGA